jgi:hypothetical protein
MEILRVLADEILSVTLTGIGASFRQCVNLRLQCVGRTEGLIFSRDSHRHGFIIDCDDYCDLRLSESLTAGFARGLFVGALDDRRVALAS